MTTIPEVEARLRQEALTYQRQTEANSRRPGDQGPGDLTLRSGPKSSQPPENGQRNLIPDVEEQLLKEALKLQQLTELHARRDGDKGPADIRSSGRPDPADSMSLV